MSLYKAVLEHLIGHSQTKTLFQEN